MSDANETEFDSNARFGQDATPGKGEDEAMGDDEIAVIGEDLHATAKRIAALEEALGKITGRLDVHKAAIEAQGKALDKHTGRLNVYRKDSGEDRRRIVWQEQCMTKALERLDALEECQDNQLTSLCDQSGTILDMEKRLDALKATECDKTPEESESESVSESPFGLQAKTIERLRAALERISELEGNDRRAQAMADHALDTSEQIR